MENKLEKVPHSGSRKLATKKKRVTTALTNELKNLKRQEVVKMEKGKIDASPPSAPAPAFLRDLFAFKNGTRFKTREELEYLISEYFASKVRPVVDEEGFFAGYKWIEKITFTGLANWLHLTTNQLKYYRGKPEFQAIFDRAKQIIEEYNEQALLDNRNPAGLCFIMKNNFGWKDSQDINVTQKHSLSEIIDPEERRQRLLNDLGVIDVTDED